VRILTTFAASNPFAVSLLFVTTHESDSDAVRHARLLLERHPEFYVAEIWKGMKMVRQI
jgi:hypothetical protein